MLLSNIINLTIILFAVIDILGNIPLILKLQEKEDICPMKGSILSSAIMIFFLFTGDYIFKMFGIQACHFALAGSLLLFFFGIKMMLGVDVRKSTEYDIELNSTIFPLSFPLIAGPGTLSTIMSIKTQFQTPEILISIILNGIIIYLVLRSSKTIGKKLGISGILIIERIFGIFLIAIAIKIFLTNLMLSINGIGI